MLKVKDLSIGIKSKEIVKNINFNLNKGEILGIVGESGSGKSLTLFSIMGLLNKNTFKINGEINFKGENLLNLKEKDIIKKRLSHIAMVYQNPFNTLSPVEKIERQIKRIYGIKNEKPNFDKVVDIFNKLGLKTEYLQKFPHELSGGEIQRVLISISLLFNPEILLCDEITTSLDTATEGEIVKLLLELRRELNISIIFVTHDLELAQKICDRIIVMKSGNIVEVGDSRDIFLNPKDDYTKKLIEFSKLGD